VPLGLLGRQSVGTLDQFKIESSHAGTVAEDPTGRLDHLGADTIAAKDQDAKGHSASTGSNR